MIIFKKFKSWNPIVITHLENYSLMIIDIRIFSLPRFPILSLLSILSVKLIKILKNNAIIATHSVAMVVIHCRFALFASLLINRSLINLSSSGVTNISIVEYSQNNFEILGSGKW